MTLQMPSSMFGTFTLTTYSSGSYGTYLTTSGSFTNGSNTTSSIRASIQPASGKELLLMEEGNRTKNWIAVWTTSSLSCGDETSMIEPDEISYGGASYVIQKVEYHQFGLSHTKALAVRKQKA